MCLACPDQEFYVSVAIDVFKAQSRSSIEFLKAFLTVIPNPACVEVILVNAVAQLAVSHPEVCRWLLRHANFLQPELNLVMLAKQSISAKLREVGGLPEQDFQLEPDQRLQMNHSTLAQLLAKASALDCLMLEEILLPSAQFATWSTEVHA